LQSLGTNDSTKEGLLAYSSLVKVNRCSLEIGSFFYCLNWSKNGSAKISSAEGRSFGLYYSIFVSSCIAYGSVSGAKYISKGKCVVTGKSCFQLGFMLIACYLDGGPKIRAISAN
jgi:hypothetical protein